jgi:hypothetical protein
MLIYADLPRQLRRRLAADDIAAASHALRFRFHAELELITHHASLPPLLICHFAYACHAVSCRYFTDTRRHFFTPPVPLPYAIRLPPPPPDADALFR